MTLNLENYVNNKVEVTNYQGVTYVGNLLRNVITNGDFPYVLHVKPGSRFTYTQEGWFCYSSTYLSSCKTKPVDKYRIKSIKILEPPHQKQGKPQQKKSPMTKLSPNTLHQIASLLAILEPLHQKQKKPRQKKSPMTKLRPNTLNQMASLLAEEAKQALLANQDYQNTKRAAISTFLVKAGYTTELALELAEKLLYLEAGPVVGTTKLEWKPISTAPEKPDRSKPFVAVAIKNYKTITLFSYTSDPCIVWRAADGAIEGWEHDFNPTHWCELPPTTDVV